MKDTTHNATLTTLGRSLSDDELSAFYGGDKCVVTVIVNSDGALDYDVPDECKDKVTVTQK